MGDRGQIEEIKSKLDIISVIGPYVPTLKRSGRNYFGLCPFHKEKTPSFSVNQELGIYKCFGCGEGGDVIKFIEKIDGIDFPKALEVAAKRAGVKLNKKISPEQIENAKIKENILKANSLASEFFQYILLKHPQGEIGREYAKKRKLTKEVIERFNIGLAPGGFENLKKFLIKKGFKPYDLVKWGLLVEKNGRIYDKFRSRLTFPVIDHQGDVVGFSCRAILQDEKGPKYLNSPETLVYQKSRTLFGLFQAKEAIRKSGFAILVEGNIDLLSSHKAGVENIVAPLGTALTIDQINLLKRYTDTVYFALDTDNAGQKALLKDLDLIDQMGMNAFVLDIGKFKDVDDLIVGGENWQEVVGKPVDIVLYFLKSLKTKYDLAQPIEKNKYIRQILEIISKIHNPLLINDYLNKLASEVNIDIKILFSELNNIKDYLQKHKLSELPSDHKISIEIKEARQKENLLFKYLLALLLNNQEYTSNIKYSEIEDLMPDELFKKVLKSTLSGRLIDKMDEEELKLYSDCILMPIDSFEDQHQFDHEINVIITRLRKEKINSEIEKIKGGQNLDLDDVEINRLTVLIKQLSSLK